MALEIKDNGDQPNIPESTGAVELQPEAPREQVADASSTGAVKYEGAGLGETVNPAAENGGAAVAKPSQLDGPVTLTTSWLSEAEAKVITKQHQDAAAASVKEPEPKPKTSAKAQTKGK